MDKKRAIDILIALACCSARGLSCEECPMWKPYTDGRLGGECKSWTDNDVIEAVRTLNGGNDNG